jgi:hypothetical protein
VRRLLADPPPRAATRGYAERFGWDDTSAGQYALFCRVLHRIRAEPRAAAESVASAVVAGEGAEL